MNGAYPDGTPNPNVSRVATEFAAEFCARTIKLDFSLKSLETDIDRMLAKHARLLKRDTEEAWQLQAGLEAYVGESLARLFDGVWMGRFNRTNPGPNFYLSYVLFGEYRYRPSMFLGYRISNGTREGRFRDHLAKVLPLVQARRESQLQGKP